MADDDDDDDYKEINPKRQKIVYQHLLPFFYLFNLIYQLYEIAP